MNLPKEPTTVYQIIFTFDWNWNFFDTINPFCFVSYADCASNSGLPPDPAAAAVCGAVLHEGTTQHSG